MMNELLHLKEGMIVFEVGTGSGYHAATLAEIVAPSDLPPERWGHVYSADIVGILAIRAWKSLEATGYANRVSVLCYDASAGFPVDTKADRILVTAAAPEPPKPLIDHLRVTGRAVMPIGRPFGFFQVQNLVVIKKTGEEELDVKSVGEVAFVPLRGRYGWQD